MPLVNYTKPGRPMKQSLFKYKKAPHRCRASLLVDKLLFELVKHTYLSYATF